MKPGIIIILLILNATLAGTVQPATAITGTSPSGIDLPKTGYWAMEGKLVRHPFPDQRDSLSGQEILELQDENGISIWFSRYFFKDVCMTRQCRMIRLWLFWDGAGNYQGIHLLEDEPLTKSDHTIFTEADYARLDGILHDTQSILKDLSPDDLEIDIETDESDAVDAYTSATLPALSQVVVQDAVYTCHTLWHTVYGPTMEAIHDILLQGANPMYIERLFAHDNLAHNSLAIKLTAGNPQYHEAFYPLIVDAIKSENLMVSNQALAYFEPAMIKDTQVQSALANVIPDLSPHNKNEIIWKLLDANETDPEVVLLLLNMFENNEIGVGSLNLLFRLVKDEHFADQRITSILDKLASSENAYIRNLTNNHFDHP